MTTDKIASHGNWSPSGTHMHSYVRPRTKPDSTHYEGCSSDEDPEGETMCVCASIEAEPAPDSREGGECQAEFIDGSWYGDDCPDCRESVGREMADCEQCEDEEYCSKHSNGIYG